MLLYLSVLLVSEISAPIARAQPTARLLDLFIATHLLNPHSSRTEHLLFADLAYLYVVPPAPANGCVISDLLLTVSTIYKVLMRWTLVLSM